MNTSLAGWLRTLLSSSVISVAVCGLDRASAGSSLDAVRERGMVTCGVTDGRPGASEAKFGSSWTGTDVDYCRAVAAAVFGDRSRVTFVALKPERRIDAVRTGGVDLVASTAILPAGHADAAGLAFPVVRFVDGLSLMVRRDAGVTSSAELRDPTICMIAYVQYETVLADHLTRLGLRFWLWTFVDYADAIEAYEDAKCDGLADAATTLAEERLGMARPEDHSLLPDRLTQVPVGPMARSGDDDWAKILRFAHEHVAAGLGSPPNREMETVPSLVAK